DARDQADPGQLGRRGFRARRRGARPERRAARRLHEAAQGVSGSTASERLAALGLALPPVAAPVAAYVPAVRTGNYVYTSGQLPFVDGKLQGAGKVGDGVTTDEAARL